MRNSALAMFGAPTEDLLAANELEAIPLPPATPAPAVTVLGSGPARPDSSAGPRRALDLHSAVKGSAQWREAVGAEVSSTELPMLDPDALIPLDDLPQDDEPLELTPPPRVPELRRPTPRPRELGAPDVVGVGPADPPRRAPTPTRTGPRVAFRQIQERNPTLDVPQQMVAPVPERPATPPPGTPVRHLQRGEALFEEALKAMVAGDYSAAERHLTLAMSYNPGDIRVQVAREKVRRVLGR